MKPEPKSAPPRARYRFYGGRMAKVPGWEERSKRMLAEYGAPTASRRRVGRWISYSAPRRDW